jgi:hypothetical protein
VDALWLEQAEQALHAAQAARTQAQQAAASVILTHTLRDLGFVVEPIEHTLFIEGGMAHFTRPDWGDYAVRLRATPTAATLNFNVVRAQTDTAAGFVDWVVQYRHDSAAEERWCAHIPKLVDTLAARGLTLDVKRRLGAGEAPVQAVPAQDLAPLAAQTTNAARPAPAHPARLAESAEPGHD